MKLCPNLILWWAHELKENLLTESVIIIEALNGTALKKWIDQLEVPLTTFCSGALSCLQILKDQLLRVIKSSLTLKKKGIRCNRQNMLNQYADVLHRKVDLELLEPMKTL